MLKEHKSAYMRRVNCSILDLEPFGEIGSIFSLQLSTRKQLAKINNEKAKINNEKVIPENPQGGTLIFSYIRRLGSFFGVQNFEFQYFWGFQKNKYFFGYEDFVDIFWGHDKIGLYLGVIPMHFKVDS